MTLRPVLFCGDPHSRFRQVVESASRTRASTVVLLGDMEPSRPLEEEMAALQQSDIEWYFIAGNHDADSQVLARRVWNRNTDPHNVHGRVVTLKGGRSTYYSRLNLERVTPRQYRFNPYDAPAPQVHHKHWASIFEEEYDALAEMQADILVTHEAPSYHCDFSGKGTGFRAIDELAQFLGARYAIHGHHHDNQDSSEFWVRQKFESHGVGLRGVSALWPDGRWEVVMPGEIDDARRRQLRASE
jgi:Icc-related predicted phosphoesterase